MLVGFKVLENYEGLASKWALLLSSTLEPGVYIKAEAPVDCIICLDSSFIFLMSSLYFDVEFNMVFVAVIGLLSNSCFLAELT